MYEQESKSNEINSRAFTNYAIHEKTNGRGAVLVDNRPKIIAQRKQKETVKNGVQGSYLNDFRDIPNKGLPLNQTAQMQSKLDNQFSNGAPIQRKVYIGKGAIEPIEEDGKEANELRAEAGELDENKSIFMLNVILPEALKSWEVPVRVAKQSEVIPFLLKGISKGKDLKTSFKGVDKLYGMEKARKIHTKPRRGPKLGDNLKHPTIDSMNKALRVGHGMIDNTGVDEETADYGIGLQKRNPDLSSGDRNARFKEACKKAVEYITMDTDGFIHFELNKIDMAAVVTKKFESITGSELRKIFREVVRTEWAEEHNQTRGNRLDINKIKFYMNGTEVSAPWIQEPELWEEYKARRKLVRSRHFRKK